MHRVVSDHTLTVHISTSLLISSPVHCRLDLQIKQLLKTLPLRDSNTHLLHVLHMLRRMCGADHLTIKHCRFSRQRQVSNRECATSSWQSCHNLSQIPRIPLTTISRCCSLRIRHALHLGVGARFGGHLSLWSWIRLTIHCYIGVATFSTRCWVCKESHNYDSQHTVIKYQSIYNPRTSMTSWHRKGNPFSKYYHVKLECESEHRWGWGRQHYQDLAYTHWRSGLYQPHLSPFIELIETWNQNLLTCRHWWV